MKKEIGKRIGKLREDMNFTKEAFAKEIGISGQYLGLIEHGKNYPSIEKLKLICEFTKTSADYILFGKDNNILNDTQSILSELSDEQICSSCEAIKNIALFIKHK